MIEFNEATAAQRLERAASLYRGPFLDGFFLPGAAEFEHWVDVRRDVLRLAYGKVLQGLTEEAAARGDVQASAEWWLRLSAEEPYNAWVTIGLMEALHAAGECAGAIRQSRRYAERMQRDYGVKESAEIDALVERLKVGQQRGQCRLGVHLFNSERYTERSIEVSAEVQRRIHSGIYMGARFELGNRSMKARDAGGRLSDVDVAGSAGGQVVGFGIFLSGQVRD